MQGGEWRQMIRDLGTRIGVIAATLGGAFAFIAAVGGAIVWTRFQAAELPAEQALDAMPRGELVATGAIALAAFGVLGVVAAAAVFLIDHGGTGQMRRTPGLSRGLLVLLAVETVAIASLAVEDVDPSDTAVGWFRWGVVAEVTVLLLLLSLTLIRTGTCFARTTEHAESGPPSSEPDASPDATAPESEAAVPEDPIPAFPWPVLAVNVAVVLGTLVVGAATDAWEPTILGGLGLLILIPFGVFACRWVYRDGRPPQEGDGLYLTRRGGALMMLLAIAAVAAPTMVMWVWWIAAPLAAAALLAIAAWVIAYMTDTGFVRYGVIVFVSVPCIGAVAAITDNAFDPQVQPMALIRSDHGEHEALQGIYVTENDERVYFASVAANGCTGEVEPHSGRMMWVSRDDVATMVVGPRQSVADAGEKALEMAYALAPAAVNPPTLKVVDGERRASRRREPAPRRLTDAGPGLRREFAEPPALDTLEARVGDEVTLRGTGFGEVRRTIRVGGVRASVVPRRKGVDPPPRDDASAPNFHWNDWAIRFVVPPGARSGPVTVECGAVETPLTLRVEDRPRARIDVQQAMGGALALDGRRSSGAQAGIVSRRWRIDGATAAPSHGGVVALAPSRPRHDAQLEIADAEGATTVAQASFWRIPFTGSAPDLATDRARTIEQIRATLAARPDATLIVHSQYRRARRDDRYAPIELARALHDALRGNERQRKGTRTLLRAFRGACPIGVERGAGQVEVFVLDRGSELLPPPECPAKTIE